MCPPTDDRPFFFNMTRLGDLASSPPEGYFYGTDPIRVLALTLVLLLVLCAVAFGLPIALVPRGRRPPARTMAFFAAIGLGFLLLEIALIQRLVLFLGFPTYALSVVLFSLLLFTGLGSLATTRLGDGRRTLTIALGTACVLLVIGAFALQPLLRALIDLPFAARVIVAVVLLAPVGFALGMAMPIGLTRLAALHPGAVRGLGGQRRRLGAGVGGGRGGRDHLRVHGGDAARHGLLPGRAGRRPLRTLGIEPGSTDPRGASPPWPFARDDRPETQVAHHMRLRPIVSDSAHDAESITDHRWITGQAIAGASGSPPSAASMLVLGELGSSISPARYAS